MEQLRTCTSPSTEEEAVILLLMLVRLWRAQAVRDHLAQLGITEQDVADAVAWARSGSGTFS